MFVYCFRQAVDESAHARSLQVALSIDHVILRSFLCTSFPLRITIPSRMICIEYFEGKELSFGSTLCSATQYLTLRFYRYPKWDKNLGLYNFEDV